MFNSGKGRQQPLNARNRYECKRFARIKCRAIAELVLVRRGPCTSIAVDVILLRTIFH